MKNKFNIIWIDDIETRENLANSLEEYEDSNFPRRRIKKVFVKAKGKQLNEVLLPLYKNKEPDLIIVDHFLDKMNNNSKVSKGSTVAQILREQWPVCPIIGISAVSNRNEIDIRSRLIYDDFFLFENFTSKFTTLLVIASNFNLLKKKRINNIDEIVKLLKPPSDEASKIKSIIGVDFKDNINDNSLVSRIYKWIRLSFRKPGFLYDELWAATLIGLNMDGFNKFKNKFDKALYKGIFSDPTNVMWWKSIIKEIIFKSNPKENSNYPWVVGRIFTKNKSFYSKCHSCGKDYPEIVGYTDERKKHKVQLHIGCSIPHPNENNTLFFEEIRIMKGEF